MKAVLDSQKMKLLATRAAHAIEIKELKEKHVTAINELRQEHKRSIKTTKVILKSASDKKAKALETICSGSHCPCCGTTGWTLNCNSRC